VNCGVLFEVDRLDRVVVVADWDVVVVDVGEFRDDGV
jgi:hypothetical protein